MHHMADDSARQEDLETTRRGPRPITWQCGFTMLMVSTVNARSLYIVWVLFITQIIRHVWSEEHIPEGRRVILIICGLALLDGDLLLSYMVRHFSIESELLCRSKWRFDIDTIRPIRATGKCVIPYLTYLPIKGLHAFGCDDCERTPHDEIENPAR